MGSYQYTRRPPIPDFQMQGSIGGGQAKGQGIPSGVPTLVARGQMQGSTGGGQMQGYGGGGRAWNQPPPTPPNLYGTDTDAGGGFTGTPWRGRDMPSVGGAPGNPYQNVDINQPAWSNEMRNAVGDARYLPGVSPYAEALPRSADAYGTTPAGARDYLGGLFGGPGGSPSESPYMNYGMDILTNAARGGPAMPGMPALTPPPGGYAAPNIGTSFDYNSMNIGGYPTSATGPNLTGVSDPNRFGFSGPQITNPSLDQLLRYVDTNSLTAPGRESIGGGSVSADPLSQQAFRGAYNASTGINGPAPDTNLSFDQTFAEAARAGANIAGGRGLTDLQGTGAGIEVGRELAAAAERIAPQRAQLALQAEELRRQGREAEADALLRTGQASAGAATDVAALNQERDLTGGQLGVTQRGQDIGLITEGNRSRTTAGDVADLYRAKTGAEIGAYEAGTGRGSTQGDLSLRANDLQRSGQLDAFRVQTDQMRALMEGVKAGNADAIARYQAATQRGEVTGDLNRDEASLAYDYATLESADRNTFNTAQTDLYQTGGNLANTAYGNETSRLDTLLTGAGNFADTAQSGDIQRRQNEIRVGELANAVMSGQADATAIDNELQVAARQGDQQYINALIQLKMNLEQGRYLSRADRTAAGYSAVGNIVGGALGGVGSYLGSKGN